MPQDAPLQPLPATLQLTPVFDEPLTEAENCWPPPTTTTALVGEMLTATGPGNTNRGAAGLGRVGNGGCGDGDQVWIRGAAGRNIESARRDRPASRSRAAAACDAPGDCRVGGPEDGCGELLLASDEHLRSRGCDSDGYRNCNGHRSRARFCGIGRRGCGHRNLGRIGRR